MRQALFVANEFSKDPSTKVGSLILDPESYAILAEGYNGMPRGVREDIPSRQERPAKYAYYEHAERNALYNAARKALKGSVVITSELPDISCARALISVGATEVYFPLPRQMTADLVVAYELFAETGVKVGHLTQNGEVITDPDNNPRLQRKLAQFVSFSAAASRFLGKDPHGSGAVFISPDDFTVLSIGYSGFPRGADDTKLLRYEGELRKQWVEGAIRNAIYNAARSLLKGSIALVTATTCVECARGLASAGVREVFYLEPSADIISRWGNSFKVALDMLDELKVANSPISLAELTATT